MGRLNCHFPIPRCRYGHAGFVNRCIPARALPHQGAIGFFGGFFFVCPCVEDWLACGIHALCGVESRISSANDLLGQSSRHLTDSGSFL